MCKIDDTHMDEMKFETVKTNKREMKKFYHENCYQKLLEERAFKEKEYWELDALRLVVQKIYGIDPLPSSAYGLLQKIRNGEPVFGSKQNIGKRYKEGYSYPLIQETYEYCSDTIEWANANKNFDGFMGAFRYGLAIIIDKLYIVEQRAKERERKRLLIDKHIEKISEDEQIFETNYKKPSKSKGDISDFLDD
ncbi:hypothetical protein [Priestia megaterium]|uniref:hypothetical protein n=1 Tax=Priestia megaterium TaxID=1404 RepID=UPI000BFE6587|nr:hypothetical protein [Priestia megaterium]PGO60618.1 hypothetical protein CN981_08700 [Priestia megaterium]